MTKRRSQPRKQRYGSIAAAREAGLSLRQLYYWVRVLRVVKPQLRRHGMRWFCAFAPRDVGTLKAVRRLLKRGYTLRAAVSKVRRPPSRSS